MSTRLHTPRFGLDSAGWVPPSDHHAVGSTVALVYLSRSIAKAIDRNKYNAYKAAGINVHAVFEDSATNALMGEDQGISDAEWSLKQATDAGMPKHRPVTFACDFDPTSPSLADEYFTGVAKVFGVDLSGPYGGIAMVQHQAARGFKCLWQTYAWSNGQLDTRAQFYQYSNDHSVGGVGVDFNHIYYEDMFWEPPKDPDPHHYLWFPEKHITGKRIHPFKYLSMRHTVKKYDEARKHPEHHKKELERLRKELHALANHVWYEAKVEDKKGGWMKDRRGWKFQQLIQRAHDKQLVK